MNIHTASVTEMTCAKIRLLFGMTNKKPTIFADCRLNDYLSLSSISFNLLSTVVSKVLSLCFQLMLIWNIAPTSSSIYPNAASTLLLMIPTGLTQNPIIQSTIPNIIIAIATRY